MAGTAVHHSQSIAVLQIERLQGNRALGLLNGLIIASELRQQKGIPVERAGVVGIQLESAPELPLCRFPLEFILQHSRQHRMGLAQRIVESQRFLRRRPSFRHGFHIRDRRILRQNIPVLPQAGVSPCVVWIFLYCLVEILF